MGLIDSYGRVAADLRLSVTDVCNLRCRYCMPAEGLPWLPKNERLSDEETVALVSIFVAEGIKTLRVTGGEPLVKPGIAKLIAQLNEIDGLQEISLTTNAVLLAKHAAALAEAGVKRVNVSLDSVDPKRFDELTRRNLLPQVLEGIAAIQAQPQIQQVKLNAVALRGVTEHEALDLCEFARQQSMQLRFIEVMPLDAEGNWTNDDVLTAAELRTIIEQRWPVIEQPRPAGSTARVFSFADGEGEVGFVASVTEPFCSDCDRVRLTADGQMRTCLFSHEETNLRDALRGGATHEQLAQLIRTAVATKGWGHEINKPGFQQPDRPMSSIGG